MNVKPLADRAYVTGLAGSAEHRMLCSSLPANPTTLFWQWAPLDAQVRLSTGFEAQDYR